MYVVREVLHCRPGKVKPLLEKFHLLSTVMREMGRQPLRMLTDVAGGPFWTLIAEAEVETLEDFFTLERRLMAHDTVRTAMADYHELVDAGRREIYRLEGHA